MLELFPYVPRKTQEIIVEDIYSSAREQRNIIIQSKTGSGKTVCSLSALLGFCMNEKKKLVYTTRTNSQQKQVISEARAIRENAADGTFAPDEILALPLQGRRNMCLLMDELTEFREAIPEEMSLMCSTRKKRTGEMLEGTNEDTQGDFNRAVFDMMLHERMCPYYYRLLTTNLNPLKRWVAERIPDAHEIVSRCRDEEICPYEFIKILLDKAQLVVMPYIFVFNDAICGHLIDWLNEGTEDLILVVDEAHNLPDYLRDLYSFTLSRSTLGTAKKEAERYGIDFFYDDIPLKRFLDLLESTMVELAEEYIDDGNSGDTVGDNRSVMISVEEDAVIPQDALMTGLMSGLVITSTTLMKGIQKLAYDGYVIKEKKQTDGKLPRSYLLSVATFLRQWEDLTEEYYIKLIYDRENPHLEAYCLDPQKGGVICQTFHSSVHMSGTLEPLHEYRDCLSLENSELHSYPSPFDANNLLTLFTPALTTRYAQFNGNEKMQEAYEREICSILRQDRRNTIIFFPSFRIMNVLTTGEMMKNITRDRPVFYERTKDSQAELLDEISSFRTSPGGIFFSVIGGRVSEGMDFPGDTLELAILVGIPYPKPTARQKGLRRYYDIKTGNGWLFAVLAPTVRKILQAMGRLIRSEEDRGVAVIMDVRAKRFQEYIDGLEMEEDVAGRVRKFFSSVVTESD